MLYTGFGWLFYSFWMLSTLDNSIRARLEKGRRAWLILLIQLPFFGPCHVIPQPVELDFKQLKDAEAIKDLSGDFHLDDLQLPLIRLSRGETPRLSCVQCSPVSSFFSGSRLSMMNSAFTASLTPLPPSAKTTTRSKRLSSGGGSPEFTATELCRS